MNKIVWVIGQSAAGKETFIKYAVANPNCELIQKLGYSNNKIIPIEESLYGDEEERLKIIELVLDLIKKETNAVILIKWQHYDTGYNVIGSNVEKLKSAIPGISNEIICLSVESDVLYARLRNKPWWNESTSSTQEQMDHVVEIMRNNIKKYLLIGFKLAAEIDATDGYKLIENSELEIKEEKSEQK